MGANMEMRDLALRALHLLYDDQLRDRVDASVLRQLRSFRGTLFLGMTDKSSAYQQVQDIIYECDRGHGRDADRPHC